MAKKISEYKKDQLPGGKYWDPTKEEKEILKQLLPNNDICESILGLNDWLSGQRPNLSQKTKSTLVEVKKKHTMAWLGELTGEKRGEILTLAQKKRKSVEIVTREEENILREQRKKKMEEETKKAKEKEDRRQAEMEKLSSIPIIKSAEELQSEITKIEQDSSCTIPGKCKKRLELLKNQVRIRNRLLGKPTKITFSTAGTQKPYEELMQEVIDMLEQESSSQKRPNSSINSRAKKTKKLATQYLDKPHDLVGKDIVHKFINEDSAKEELWDGKILGYDASSSTHSLTYTGDTEIYEYDLTTDINNGDIWVLL